MAPVLREFLRFICSKYAQGIAARDGHFPVNAQLAAGECVSLNDGGEHNNLRDRRPNENAWRRKRALVGSICSDGDRTTGGRDHCYVIAIGTLVYVSKIVSRQADLTTYNRFRHDVGRALLLGFGNSSRCRHHSDGRSTTDGIQRDRSRSTRADPNLSELVAGVGNRGAVAVAAVALACAELVSETQSILKRIPAIERLLASGQQIKPAVFVTDSERVRV